MPTQPATVRRHVIRTFVRTFFFWISFCCCCSFQPLRKSTPKKIFVGLVLFRLSRMFHPKVFTLMTLWATFDELECTLLPKHHFTAHFITVSAIFFFFIFFSSPLFLCCFLF